MREKEIIIDLKLDLNEHLRLLNGLLLRTASALKDSNQIFKAWEELMMLYKRMTMASRDKKELETLFHSLRKKDKYATSDHAKVALFMSGSDLLKPWLGEITNYESPLYAAGLVMGLILCYDIGTPTKPDVIEIKYRLDYDPRPEKQLHFNFALSYRGRVFNYALCKVTPPALYYGIYDPKSSLAAIKFKFFIKMTYSLQGAVDPDVFARIIANTPVEILATISLADKGERDEIIAQLIQAYTSKCKDKDGRIGHGLVHRETDSEAEHTDGEGSKKERGDEGKGTTIVRQVGSGGGAMFALPRLTDVAEASPAPQGAPKSGL